jgi:hypothetical protein
MDAQVLDSPDQSAAPGAGGDSIKVLTKSPKGAMLRSLAVPGWGQLYNGKRFKAIIIMGAEIGLISNAIIQNQLAAEAGNEYDREFYRENRSLSIWWLGAVILFSITDAFVDAHLFDFDESPVLSCHTGAGRGCHQVPGSSTLVVSLKITL